MTAKRKADIANTEALLRKWGINGKSKLTRQYSLKASLHIPSDQSTSHIPSKDTWSGDTAKHENPKYTGDAVLGISTMHKSNLVPIFSKEEAIDNASMRR